MPSFHAVSFTATLMSVHKGKLDLADLAGLHVGCHSSHILINTQVYPDMVPLEVSWLNDFMPKRHSNELDCEEFGLVNRDKCDGEALATWTRFSVTLKRLQLFGLVCYQCGDYDRHAEWLVSQGRRVWLTGQDQTAHYRDRITQYPTQATAYYAERTACRPGAGALIKIGGE